LNYASLSNTLIASLAPHSQPNPTPSPCCACSGSEWPKE